MVIAAAMEKGYFWTWLVLLFASAGVFHHAGIKIPYFAFFAHDSGKRCKEAPWNMLVAMAIAAALCIGIGSFPGVFYKLLPYPVEDFVPFSLDHVVGQTQLLFLSALAFTLLMRTGIYPPELRSINLDFDWFYRRAAYRVVQGVYRISAMARERVMAAADAGVQRITLGLYRHHGPEGALARSWPTGAMAFWVAVMLAAFLILSYV
jgi:multicomponent Na+:H+ antiporter subunit D